MKKHGLYGTPTYQSWTNMLGRCRNERNPRYKDYGGRGITVHPDWYVFSNFIADMGMRPEGLTLERRDNEKGYSRDNCYWADRSTQMSNRRPPGRDRGKPITPSDWRTKPRDVWSEMSALLKTLEPGKTLSFEVPDGVAPSSFRSRLLIYGNRYHKNDWKVRTTMKDGLLVCFLVPSEKAGG